MLTLLYFTFICFWPLGSLHLRTKSGQPVVQSSHGVTASPLPGMFSLLYFVFGPWVLYTLCWDVTAVCTVADSMESGALAELEATRKRQKYSALSDTHIFRPLSFKSHGLQNISVTSFIKDLEHRISQRSDDDRETHYLFQQLSVIVQRTNALIFGECFLAVFGDPDMWPLHYAVISFCFRPLGSLLPGALNTTIKICTTPCIFRVAGYNVTASVTFTVSYLTQLR